MNLSNLWNSSSGNGDIYIIGTGPSLRVFPVSYLVELANKPTIGLNQAYRSLPFFPVWNLTIHPELIQRDYLIWAPQSTWITKKKDWLSKPTLAQIDNTYFFENNASPTDWDWIWHPGPSHLYVGRGIHTAALVLAARMGFSRVFMLGVDLGATGGEHHATGQAVRFHGLSPADVYREYYLNARILVDKLELQVITLSPYLGIGHEHEDHLALLNSKGLNKHEKPKDESKYKRKELDFS